MEATATTAQLLSRIEQEAEAIDFNSPLDDGSLIAAGERIFGVNLLAPEFDEIALQLVRLAGRSASYPTPEFRRNSFVLALTEVARTHTLTLQVSHG